MSWDIPSIPAAGTIATVAGWATKIINCLRYLKGLDSQVPTIQSGLIIDNTDGDEYLKLPLLSTVNIGTTLDAEGEVAFDEQTHQMKEYDGTAVRAIISEADVDDTPVNGATTVPVSSNWAYDFINTLTTQADLPYATAAGVWTRLAKGTGGQFLKMNSGATAPEWGAASFSSKLLNHSRLGADASGDVAYTSYGFLPKALIIFAVISANPYFSLGFGDENLAEMCLISPSANYYLSTTSIINPYNSAGNSQVAVLKTLDADGFTLTWTKNGTGGSDITFIVLALT